MEPEFDKEIDVLLRKAATGGSATAPVLEPHLDADEISMFAENALPDSARSRVVVHMADCDRCRTILANVISLNAESEPAPAAVPASSIEVAADQTGSWLSGLFSTKNLAFGFGAMALLFAGFMGFAVIQNMNSGNAELARADSNTMKAPPQSAAANTNAASLGDSASEDSFNEPEEVIADSDEGQSKTLMLPDNSAITGKDIAKRQKAPENDSFADRGDLSGRRENKPAAEKNESRAADLAAETESVSEPPPPVAAGESQPTVSVITPRGGVARSQAEPKKAKERDQDDKQVGDGKAATASRTINGKTFTRRNGTWFDSAYKNQATKTVIRGTTEFQSLDAGVRSIADQLSGTVVVVWKAKALKIQ